MTNADWISKKITEFFEKNRIRIWKISLIVCIISLISIFALHCIYLLALFVPSFIITIVYSIVFIDEWMEKEHKGNEDFID